MLCSLRARDRRAIREVREALAAELSTYTLVAARYAKGLGLPQADLQWLRRQTGIGRALRLLDLGHAPLRGLPLALLKAAFPKT